MTDEQGAEILSAAMTIRRELATLVPADADELGATLDEHLTRAKAASAEERPAIVDDIMDVLSRHEPTRERLHQLVAVIDTNRGIPDGLWPSDVIPPGKIGDDKQEVEITCLTCGYANEMAFRPPPDDPPRCQNPEPPSHLLGMA